MPTRTRRFVSGHEFGNTGGPASEDQNYGSNLNKFILENSYVDRPAYGRLDGGEENFQLEGPSQSSSRMLGSSHGCANPKFIAGSSNYRFICFDYIKPRDESSRHITSVIPDRLTKADSSRLMSDLQSFLSRLTA